jgi:predicted SAM-dependent methyltransferase
MLNEATTANSLSAGAVPLGIDSRASSRNRAAIWLRRLSRDALERLVWLRQHATWLKPPYRTARSFTAHAYSTWNFWRADDIRRVNVGCGKDVRDGWWNLDYIYFPGVDEIRDATRPWRHRNLDFVFSEHFIEHLTLFQAIDFLTHAGNALREGGVMRLSTPNVTAVIRESYTFNPASESERLHDTIDINSCFHAYGHQFLFSAEFLRFLLEELGFQDVRQHNFGESERPELRGLEKHGIFDFIHGEPNLAIFEASKGPRPIAPSTKLRAMLDRHFTRDQVYR